MTARLKSGMQKLLHNGGAKQATVKCVATKPGQASDFILRINGASLHVLRSIVSEHDFVKN